MPDIDLSQLSDEELQELTTKIEHEIEKRKEQKKREVLQQMKELAAQIDTTPEELLGMKKRRGTRRKTS